MKKTMVKLWSLLAIGVLMLPSVYAAGDFNEDEYRKALWMTTRFYGGQRSGLNNWLLYNHLPAGVDEKYRGTAHIEDSDGNYDLSGGWHDCGDHVKFGQTQFYSAYLLLKAYYEFKQGYDDHYSFDFVGYNTAGDYTWEGKKGAPNGIPDIVDEVKHATDFFIKCAKSSTVFYYQVGNGGSGGTGGDHTHRVTATLSQTLPNDEGGQDRPIGKNPAGSAMASFCSATLSLMARVYEPFDPDYAALCKVHAKYAYDYAKANKGAAATAFGGFYGENDNYKNSYAIMLSELFWSTGEQGYKTEALGMSAGNSNGVDVVPNLGYTFDYANNGELALYVLAQLGHTDALAAFNSRMTAHFLASGSYNGEGAYSEGGSWGKLRYVGNAALMGSLYAKINNVALDQKVYDNVDYVMGSNNAKLSFISGFIPAGGSTAKQPHHRNVFLDDSYLANTAEVDIPVRNQQFGALVGGSLTSTSYSDKWSEYVNTEVCIDYNAGLVGALGAINAEVSPVDTNKFGHEAPMLGDPKTLCGTGEATLNIGMSALPQVTINWYKLDASDNPVKMNEHTGKETIKVTEAGTYMCEFDSVGEWQTKAKVAVSDVLPSISLGDDFELCDPASKTVSIAVSGDGINYTWKHGSKVLKETSSSLTIYQGGEYSVTVSALGCSDVTDNLTVTSTLPIATHDTICQAGTVSLSINGQGGPYEWYDSEDGGSPLETGNSYSPSISASTTYYVKDAGSVDVTVGVSSTNNSLSTLENRNFQMNFSVESPLEIVEFKSTPTVHYCGPDTKLKHVFELYKGGTKVGTYTTIEISCTGEQKNHPYQDFYTFTFDTPFLITEPGDYTLKMGSGSAELPWYKEGADFDAMSEPGIITFSWDGIDNNFKNSSFGMYDIVVKSGSQCARTPVLAVIDPTIPNCGQSTEITQSVTLENGWNLIGLGVELVDNSLESVFGNQFSKVKVVKDAENFYKSSNRDFLNTLREMTPGKGYFVLVEGTVSLTLQGEPLTNVSVAVKQGWNMISYPYEGTATVQDGLQSMWNQLNSVKSLDEYYIKGGSQNSLDNLSHGDAYLLKSDSNGLLEY